MQDVIKSFFNFLAIAFNKIPALNKLSGYRAIIGYLGLAVVYILTVKGFLSIEQAAPILAGFELFKDLSLNAKGRDQ